MLFIHQYALYLHIAIGSCALIAFWIPVFTHKGNLDHKRFGRYFAYAMYAVSLSGITMASLDLLFPLATHAAGASLSAEQAARAVTEIRGFALFLLSLSILVLNSTRQGWLTIKHKADRSALRAPVHTALCTSLIVVGIALFINGLASGSALFIIFAILQVVSGVNCLRYNFKQELGPKEWWIQHLGGFIGSGIGAYTAFLIFGGRHLFESIFGDSFSDISLVLWITPGVVGGLAITYLSRRYRRRFSGEWAIKHAKLRTEMFN